MSKNAGILLHITSLPSEFGIGDIGDNAYKFADLLARHHQKYWQILPLNWCGYGNSPYNPISAFASFPYLISPQILYQDGWIDRAELMDAYLPESETVDYASVYRTKDALFAKAVPRFLASTAIRDHIESHPSDLKPFLAYQMLCRIYEHDDWYRWFVDHQTYSDNLFERLWRRYEPQISHYASLQAIFDGQFQRLHRHLSAMDIKLIGDIPLYCSYNSADVWANQHLFDLDEIGRRITVSGVPPDAFSEEGQLWGNPTFRWDKMAEDSFAWWLRRIGNALKYNDLIRLDHFIGYVNYWSIPAEEKTAVNGKWIPAPAEKFFDVLFSHYDASRFIAEDLGILNDEVCRIRNHYSLPGMIVLQFCFGTPDVDPALYPADRIIYTGTHDNDTIRGWYRQLAETDAPALSIFHQYLIRSERSKALTDCQQSTLSGKYLAGVHWQFIDIAYASPCHLAMVPFQDILGLGSEARMNTPGIPQGNWQWRIPDDTCLHSHFPEWQDLITKNMRNR